MEEYKIIETGSHSILIRKKNGKFSRIPRNKFFDGQVVVTDNKYFSPKEVTILIRPTWVDERGWVYGEEYCKIENGSICPGGGCGFSFEEKWFHFLSNPYHIVLAEKLYREREKQKTLNRLKILEFELANINFVIETIKGAPVEKY